MATRQTGKDAYGELGVRRGADDAEILAAYRHLARRFHPDLAGEVATRRMSRINTAFGRIRDADARMAYDAALIADGIDGPWRPTERRREARPPQVVATARPAATAGPRSATAPVAPVRRLVVRPGSVLPFGRHIDWSIGEIARVDPGYLAWLEDRSEGRPYLDEIDRTLRRVGYRRSRGRRRRPSAPRGRRRWSR